MPSADRNDHVDERGEEKGSKQKSSSKSKDLSHVPCKFFKVGSCTAGASCPFSHSMQEPGGQKDVCAWFVKGNCKFGHKCALAHILPGQSPAMDRKNKKAAQAAAGTAKDKGPGGGRGVKRDNNSRNPLLSSNNPGSRSQNRPPITMPLKASISAPAPALKDTDFPSFDDIEETKLSTAPANKQPFPEDPAIVEKKEKAPSPQPTSELPAPLPASSPRRPVALSPRRPPIDFGPIGSPPRSASSTTSPRSLPRPNGVSPGTSPKVNGANNFISGSPFSAPGTQATFMNYADTARGGIAASLGSGLAMGGGYSISVDNVVDDGDMEDFIPSSLTDLLTPEERNRRMSRSNSGQGKTEQLGVPLSNGGVGSSGSGNGHRYSRSVPAPSLLGDISAIWSDNASPSQSGLASAGLASSPSRLGLGSGTPSSFTSPNAFGGRSFGDDLSGTSPGMLLPSNASAAFLHGNLHQQYAKRQTGLGIGSGSGLRNTSNPFIPAAANLSSAGNTNYAPLHSATSTQFSSSQQQNAAGEYLRSVRPIPGQQQQQHDDPHVLSPGTIALQAHAPGQSLPQGLAAGYSRIHALPPLPVASPGSIERGGGSFSISPGANTMFAAGPYGTADWGSSASPSANSNSGVMGLETAFSKLSYSAAASKTSNGVGAPPGIQRNVSGGGRWGQHAPLSPLSGPVVTGDDDDLFSMDG